MGRKEVSFEAGARTVDCCIFMRDKNDVPPKYALGYHCDRFAEVVYQVAEWACKVTSRQNSWNAGGRYSYDLKSYKEPTTETSREISSPTLKTLFSSKAVHQQIGIQAYLRES